MENPAEYVVIGWKMMVALVGGSGLIGALGVGLLARFTGIFDAYAGERAKIEAQFRTIEKLVANTEKLTAATETIKAKVSDETWDRQQRWAFKQSFYRELIESLNLLYHAHMSRAHYRRPDDEGVDIFLRKSKADSKLEAAERLIKRTEEFNTLVRVAALVVDSTSYHIVFNVVNTTLDGDELLEHLHKALIYLTISARKDLGYSPLEMFPHPTSDLEQTCD